MLNRQRVIIEFLRAADRPVSRFQLTKWCFLLKNETKSEGGSAFYDFLPYKFGPFSFALYQELDKLMAMRIIEASNEHANVLTDLGEEEDNLSMKVRSDVRRIVNRFGTLSRNKVVDYVYEKYPNYTFNSEIRQLTERPEGDLRVYTAGYEGRSVDTFLHLLLQAGIRRLIDVRMNPIARRYGFHKRTMNRLCGHLGIEYVHVPALGIRSEKRSDLNDLDDYNALFADYEATTLKEEDAAIDEVVTLAKDKPSVLVCMEADHCYCHRSRLANEVANRSGLQITHLGSDDG